MIDPQPFTQWGVLGLLGLVIIVLLGVVFKLFNSQAKNMEDRDKIIMDFVDRHRGETTTAMKDVAGVVASSNDRMAQAFARQSRALDEVLLTNRVLDQVEKKKTRGTPLTDDDIERVVRTVLHERGPRGIGE